MVCKAGKVGEVGKVGGKYLVGLVLSYTLLSSAIVAETAPHD